MHTQIPTISLLPAYDIGKDHYNLFAQMPGQRRQQYLGQASYKRLGLSIKPGKEPAYLLQVIEKMRDHPEFQGMPKTEIKRLAKKLSNTELMKEYFHEYLQENTLQVTSSGLQAMTSAVDTTGGDLQDTTSAVKTTDCPDIQGFSATFSPDVTHSDDFSHVKRITAFPVKYIPDYTTS